MAVKIRLQRHGRGKRPFYYIVAADARSPRDGKYIDRIGDYNPLTVPASIHLDVDKAVDWLQKGAEATNTVKAILKYKGVMFKKHLLRGVAKGSFTAEVAETKYQEWMDAHKNAVLDHQHKIKKDKQSHVAKLMEEETKIKEARESKRAAALAAKEEEDRAKKAAEAPVEETPVAEAEATATETPVTETETPAVEEAPATQVTETPAVEEAPAAEATETKEEAN